ncbi:MAG: transcription termination/antitermination protein NusA [Chloroflexi bacterium]|nr:transcription termination/antitermination protein NusA [Chloroflexota bacterium]MBI3930750.1 transcription termination/antitermination protein NusA [Chloroflexota bacterium]
MKSDFLLAITQLAAEKNLPQEVVLAAVEAALVLAYQKESFTADQNISVKINPTSGKVEVWAEKVVVEHPSDSRRQISLAEVRRIKSDAQLDETIVVEATPHNAGRIAAQTAKQVILQRLHEAEHSAIFEEYADREGDIVTGLVQRIEPRQIFVDLGRTEAILPAAEQVASERYRVGQRVKVSILEVVRTSKGPRVVLSRSHPNLLRRLLEMEVPEISLGTVELKAIAREAGSRSKVAVAASQAGVDPVGCCVGLRGIRIQNIVNELNGEKIDIVMWNPDASLFIANALSPAQILNVELHGGEGLATVVVPDRQLSLAIGREGQNVRLAAKLTGWRIDIKSASVAEAEKAEAEKVEAERAEMAQSLVGVEAEAEVVIDEGVPAEIPLVLEPVLTSAEVAEPLPSLDTAFVSPPAVAKPKLRFAEDILAKAPTKPQTKVKKKKKRNVPERDGEEDGSGARKLHREREIYIDDEDEEEKY